MRDIYNYSILYYIAIISLYIYYWCDCADEFTFRVNEPRWTEKKNYNIQTTLTVFRLFFFVFFL